MGCAVEEMMFATTLATLYISYLFWLGITGPKGALKGIAAARDESDETHPREVMLRIHEKRYAVWIAGTTLSALCSEMYCIFVIASSSVFRGSLMEDVFGTFHFWTAFASSVCTRWASKPGQEMSSRQILILTTLINFFGLVNSIDLSNHLVCANYLGRMFVASFSPDIGFTVQLNVYMIPFAIACGYYRQGPGCDFTVLSELIVNEVVSVTFMSVVLGQLNYLNIKQEKANMELEENVKKQDLHIKEREALLNAAKSLLAVMCDCCEQLSHDWKILQPSDKVLEMFRFPNLRKERPKNFDLVQCIAVEDQDRFTNFIATSLNAPSALHLQMKDFHGRLFDVQLFHMPVPSLLTEDPQHLVGIITKDNREHRELPRARKHRDVIASIASIPEGAILDDEVAGTSSSSDDVSIKSKGSQRLSNLEDQRSSPGFVTDPLQFINLIDSVKMNVDLHTGQKGYHVRKLLFSFKEPTTEDGLKLFSFLKRRYRVVVEDWLQEHVNSWYHGVACDEKCLGTKLSLSGLGSIAVGEMNVLGIWSQEEQFTLDLEMKKLLKK